MSESVIEIGESGNESLEVPVQSRLIQKFALAVTMGVVGCSSNSGDDSASGGSSSLGGSTGVAGTAAAGTSGAGIGAAGAAGAGVGVAGADTGFGGAGTGGGVGSAGASGGVGTAGAGGSAGGAIGTAGAGGSLGGGTGTAGAAGTAGAGGTAGTGGTTAATKFVGNITTDNGADTAGLTFSKYWDEITPENAGKWGSVQSSATSAFNWSALDAIHDYAKKAGIIFKQHNFVWGAQQPSGNITQANVQNWISSFCTRYPDTKLIDVVNEPPPHTTPSYADAIGGGTNGDWKWISNVFTWAHASCGSAILILNDYNNIEYGDNETHFIDIVTKIKAGGAPIDAVGAQAHDVYKLSAATLQANLNTLNKGTGLPVYITEYDVSNADDTGQLNTYKAQFPIFMNTTYVHGITIWGWIYGKTWQQAVNSGLVNNGKSRPAMTWLMGQLGRPAP